MRARAISENVRSTPLLEGTIGPLAALAASRSQPAPDGRTADEGPSQAARRSDLTAAAKDEGATKVRSGRSGRTGGPHQCMHCSRTYKRRKDLNYHMRQKHKKEWDELQQMAKADDDAKPFQCTFCSMRFATWGALYTHRSRHHR